MVATCGENTQQGRRVFEFKILGLVLVLVLVLVVVVVVGVVVVVVLVVVVVGLEWFRYQDLGLGL